MMSESTGPIWYRDNNFRYYVVPFTFVAFFTAIVQYMAIVGQSQQFNITTALHNYYGNQFSWSFILIQFLWALIWLKIPSKTIEGPETPFGYRPRYQDNGIQYYMITSLVYLLVHTQTNISCSIYDNMPQILGSLNNVALVLCLWLLMKGKYMKEHEKDVLPRTPVLYEFYRGVELHPRVFGVDVKQMTNCRIGMMGWQIYIYSYYFTSMERNGFDLASLVCLLVQTIYIAKFFYWESGYFYTLDMMLDRAGYYICWGCLVWIPCLFTYTSYYLVAHVPVISTSTAIVLFIIGIAAIFLTYRVDYEKQKFRSSRNHQCTLWGKPAKYMIVEYRDVTGKDKKSVLLLSGFWGVARHTNYFFDLASTFAWSACGLGHGTFPFLCFYFLAILFVHRMDRDEDKCKKKYGKYWLEYCKRVPCRIIPYVW